MSKGNVVHEVRTGGKEETIGTLLGRIPQDLRTVISTHVAVYKLEAARRGQSAGVGVGLFVVAILLLQAALVTLAVGLVTLLAMWLGVVWALVAVVGLTLLLTGLVVWLGLQQVKRAINPDGQS